MPRIIQLYFSSEEWKNANPVLMAGEMGIEKDTRKFKFGDGHSHWRDLLYADGQNEEDREIITLPSLQDFPNIGNENKIYRSVVTSKLYQWVNGKYEQLDNESVSITDIDCIIGGDASEL